MSSVLEQILDNALGIGHQPTPEEVYARNNLDLDIVSRLWGDDSRDSRAVQAFIESCRIWFGWMERAEDDTQVNRRVHTALSPFIEGMHKSLDELNTLGRLRADAIEAATGTNPLSKAEEDQLRTDLVETFRAKAEQEANVGGSGWVAPPAEAG